MKFKAGDVVRIVKSQDVYNGHICVLKKLHEAFSSNKEVWEFTKPIRGYNKGFHESYFQLIKHSESLTKFERTIYDLD